MVYSIVDEVLVRMGLPVKCRKCKKQGFVRPISDYGGWFKSKIFRAPYLRWYCPKHYKIGEAVDARYNTTGITALSDTTEEELYALLD